MALLLGSDEATEAEDSSKPAIGSEDWLHRVLTELPEVTLPAFLMTEDAFLGVDIMEGSSSYVLLMDSEGETTYLSCCSSLWQVTNAGLEPCLEVLLNCVELHLELGELWVNLSCHSVVQRSFTT